MIEVPGDPEKVDPHLFPKSFLSAKAFYQSFKAGEIKTQAGTTDEVIMVVPRRRMNYHFNCLGR